MASPRSPLIGQLMAAARLLLLLTLVLGVAYPLTVLAVGQTLLRDNADGSLVRSAGRAVGSDLIGQSFGDANTGEPLARYFQSRPSHAGAGYDPRASSASNLGPESVNDVGNDPTTSQDGDKKSLLSQVCARGRQVARSNSVDPTRPFCAADGSSAPDAVGRGANKARGAAVPPDAVTASGSGLDPHISPAYALLQVDRVAKARGLDRATVRQLVQQHVQQRVLGFLGEPRVNVLRLNLALDTLAP